MRSFSPLVFLHLRIPSFNGYATLSLVPTVLLCDNNSIISISKNPIEHERIKIYQ